LTVVRPETPMVQSDQEVSRGRRDVARAPNAQCFQTFLSTERSAGSFRQKAVGELCPASFLRQVRRKAGAYERADAARPALAKAARF
jgi:hypothetical protein